MSQIKFMRNIFMILFAFSAIMLTSCSDDSDDNPDVMVEISVNGTILFDDGDDFNGDVDGDFEGRGGSDSRKFVWMNNLATADYNADITATTDGSFQMIVRDANDMVVLDRTLMGGQEPDSFSGVTSSGASGLWSVSIILVNFTGDGSFSLSEGD